MKKGQITSKIFLLIFGVIIAGIILIWGFSSMIKLSDTQDTIELKQIETQITEKVESLKMSRGTVESVQIELPEEYSEICIIDIDMIVKGNGLSNLVGHPRIVSSVNDGIEKNIFIYDRNNQLETLYVKGIKIPGYPYYRCFEFNESENNYLDMSFEGAGDGTLVKLPPTRRFCKNAETKTLCVWLDEVFGSGYNSSCCQRYSYCCPGP